MRRTAIISDIHGNLPALRAVLADAARQGAERYAFLGDYVFDMPWSNEVCETLMDLKNAVFIAGNKEERLQWLSLEDPEAGGCEQVAVVYETLRELKPEYLSWLKSLPAEARLPLEGGGAIKLVHIVAGAPGLWREAFSSGGYFRRSEGRAPSHAGLLKEFDGELNSAAYADFVEGIDADALAFGHNHLQSWCRSRSRVIIDPGSAGQPLDFVPEPAYVILEEKESGLRVIERRVPYDVEAAIRAAKDTETYACGKIWCELVFLSLRFARDYMSAMLRLAAALAHRRGIAARPFPNDLWREAYDRFSEQLEAGVFYPVLGETDR